MLPTLADALNAAIEVVAAGFLFLSVIKVYRDKKVRGVSWLSVAYFVAIGFWNLAYFAAINSPWSFKAGILITAVNTLYLAMLLYYGWHEGRPKLHCVDKERMFCETWSGKKFYVLDPDPASVDVEDIGHALGNMCRYMGHTDGPNNGFYSVAEHCCLMSDWCLAQGWGPERAFAALIHDAGEPYAGDQPRPWKAAVPILKELEQRVDDVVLPAIGGSSEKPAWLDEIDARIIMDERGQARRPSPNKWMTDSLEPLGVTLQFWTPAQATTQWMVRYHELSAQMGGQNGVADIHP